MMRLDDREWKDFAVPEIFQNIQRGKRLKNADHIPGVVPYVSSTANNNGVDDYIEASDGTRVFENCISLANSGSVGTAFYEPFAFVASDHVTSLKCKEANKYIYLFLKTVLEKQGSNFNFNREINDLRIKKMRVMLPVSDNGKPDFQFMEDFVCELMTKKRKQYRNFVEKRLKSLELDGANRGGYYDRIKSCQWRAFTIKDIAYVFSGRDIYEKERIDGNTPLVTAVGVNNGIGYFVGNDNDSKAEGSISVVRNGASVGKAFYHKYPALYGNDCRRIKLINTDSEFASLFITQVIRMQNKAFSYSRKLGTARLENLKIMLPVTNTGEPNYDFMEKFGKKIVINKYIQYLTYLLIQKDVKQNETRQ